MHREDIPDTQDIHMISVLDSTDSVIDIHYQDLLVFVCRSVIGCLKYNFFYFLVKTTMQAATGLKNESKK